ncbi:DUF1680 domain protein [Metarhizium robertsii]|uniref:DUF1680 domain protein n=2 Tax=Metarhizium robertsii TaxID=568076 RepID=E9F6Q1_METRA|nr:DUF1680 domain protein [Metarhizium robertsii ARSEF 23]EFY96667.2 DUF1680 domain protein [Metarhizium robertsii ARSEF 23]EXU98993.1 DUF1680 domain protein [Metarhizium robertsii]
MSFEPAPIDRVSVSSPFYLQIDERMRKTTLQAILDSLKSTGRFYALSWTPESAPTKAHCFWDSDVYKTMEACCYYLMKKDDAQIRADVEEIVGYIKKAQWEDGYINSYFTLHDPNGRFTNLRDMHELYCMGHLAEFAVAYYQLTGSHDLIHVMRKATQLLRVAVLPKGGYPGHQELEIGLLRLYEITREGIFLETAEFFLRERGKKDENGRIYYDREALARDENPSNSPSEMLRRRFKTTHDYSYMQAHMPLVDQHTIEGHCVRAMYFVTGAAHYALVKPSETKDIRDAVHGLFNNAVKQKMYITGGLGSVAEYEGFGPDYHLPDLQGGGCYSETCASVALVFLCERLLRSGPNRLYGDVMERALLNCVLGAVGSQGAEFYYENPLATIAGQPWCRQKWFETSCCPPNVAKLMGMLPSLIFSTRGSTVAIHLFVSSVLKTVVDGHRVQVTMETPLPWEGTVRISVNCQKHVELAIRIPDWAAAGYTTSAKGHVREGYFYVSVVSSSEIRFSFPTQHKMVYAHPSTRKDEVAVTRGPIVYCAEGPDNNFDLETTYVDVTSLREVGELDIDGWKGVPMLELDARVKSKTDDTLYSWDNSGLTAERKTLKLIPFFLRMNRGGSGAMRVWFKKDGIAP